MVTRRSGENELKGRIDPARGWNIVRTQWLKGGHVSFEARIGLRKDGERWAPSAIAYYAHNYKEGQEPTSLVTITHAAAL